MEYKREKDFQQKATYDSFEEFYTSFDLSVEEKYDSGQGYPFDYPLRWLNDPSMNKKIAIRRLTCKPSFHIITLKLVADDFSLTDTIEITSADNLVKVLSGMRMKFSINGDNIDDPPDYSLYYNYDSGTNHLEFSFWQNDTMGINFKFEDPDETLINGERVLPNIDEFLKFLNQDLTDENRNILLNPSVSKKFNEVWNRDEIFFHASFSSSNRKFIGISGDFYMTPTVLYPPPTNESTFYIRTTTNGSKNILIRHCVFMVQLVFIVNFMKTKIL